MRDHLSAQKRELHCDILFCKEIDLIISFPSSKDISSIVS